MFERSTGVIAAYGISGWETGTLRGSRLLIDGKQVVAAQAGAIADPSGGVTVDAEARFAITEMLLALRHHGLISA